MGSKTAIAVQAAREEPPAKRAKLSNFGADSEVSTDEHSSAGSSPSPSDDADFDCAGAGAVDTPRKHPNEVTFGPIGVFDWGVIDGGLSSARVMASVPASSLAASGP